MHYDTRMSIIRLLETENRPIVGFETYGVKEIPEYPGDPHCDSITVKCPDEEAQSWGVYARVQDGALTIGLWLIDVEDKAIAERLRDLLTDIKNDLGRHAVNMDIYLGLERKYMFGNEGRGYLS